MNDLITKSFENYINLKRQAMKDEQAEGDLEMGAVNPNLQEFFTEVDEIKENMVDIRNLLASLQKANDESKTIHQAQAMKALRVKMDKDIVSVLKKANGIKGKLEALDEANLANRNAYGCEEGTSTDRTRISVTNGLKIRLKDLMGEFDSLRKKLLQDHKETVERRYFTVTGEPPSEDDVEKIVYNGDSEMFLQKAIQSQGRGQVYDTINEIQERHDAAKDIEKSLLELHQIFLDMSVLVETQGEHLNDIEHHVTNAADYVSRGTGQLQGARSYQRSSRKCMCIGIILLLILVLVIVIPIAASLSKS